MKIKNIDHLNLTVKNLAESVRWYDDVFGFKVVETGTRTDTIPWAIVRSGDTMLCLYEHANRQAPPDWQDPEIAALRINHFGLRIQDKAAWEDIITRHRLEIRYGGKMRFPHSTSWYLLDPTGHEIEVTLWDGDEIRFEFG